MKNFLYSFIILFVLFISGCDENPVQPVETLAQKINQKRPYDLVKVYRNNEINYISDFTKARAKEGVFIVSNVYGSTKYFNLSTVDNVEIGFDQSSYISLYY